MTTHQPDTTPASNLPDFQAKIRTPAEAVATVKPGDRVYVGTACATPRALTRALEAHKGDLANVMLFHFLTNGALPYEEQQAKTRFQHRCFFVGSDEREAVKQNKADYVPISIAQVPNLINSGRLTADVAFIQVSPPDRHGYVSLGVSVDISRAVALTAKTVIAEINPNMPRTLGDSFLHLNQIDYLVPVDDPIIEYTHPPADAVAHYKDLNEVETNHAHYVRRFSFPQGDESTYTANQGTIGAGAMVPAVPAVPARLYGRRAMSDVTDDRVPPRAQRLRTEAFC